MNKYKYDTLHQKCDEMEYVDPKDCLSPTKGELKIANKMITRSELNKKERTLDDEREFMENLLVQRFNFLLVVFTLFTAASFSATDMTTQTFLFFVGALMCFLVAKVVDRAHVKHRWIMRLFYYQRKVIENKRENFSHAIEFINDSMENQDPKLERRRKRAKSSISKMVGDFIPKFCWIFLLLCCIVSTLRFTPIWKVTEFKLLSQKHEIVFSDKNQKSINGMIQYFTKGNVMTYRIKKKNSNWEFIERTIPLSRIKEIK